jgi:hypothetical protein
LPPAHAQPQPVPRNGAADPRPAGSAAAPRLAEDRGRPRARKDNPWWARTGPLVTLAVVAGVVLCVAVAVVGVAFHRFVKQQTAMAEDDDFGGPDGGGLDMVIAGGGGEAPDPGPETGALRFTGRSYVELARTRGLLDLNRDFSIEMWARWSPLAEKPLYLAGDEAWPGMSPNVHVPRPCGWVLRTTAPEGGRRAVDFTIAAGSGKESQWVRVVGAPGTDSGGWQHVAVCKSADEIRVYWNGKLHARQACKGQRFVASPTDLYLGVRQDAHVDRSFDGDVREFRLSSAVLYTRDFHPEPVWHLVEDRTDLVFLDFWHNDGANIRDASGKEHHGRIEGAEWVNPSALPQGQ